MSKLCNAMERDLRRGLFRDAAPAAWQAAHAYSAGDRVYSSTANGLIFECTSAGTSGGSEPSWNTTFGATTTDNGATWTCYRAGVPQRPVHVALIVADRGYWQADTVYSTGDFVIPNTPNGRLYKCTTGGTSDSSEPTWGTTNGGTTNDGTAVWTEQTNALDDGDFPEVSGSGYARVAVAPGDSNWSADDPADGATDNVNSIQYGSPLANWGLIFGTILMSAATGGIGMIWSPLTTPKTVNNGDDAPDFPAGAYAITFA